MDMELSEIVWWGKKLEEYRDAEAKALAKK